MFGLKQSDIDEIIKILQAYPAVEEVLIFGSRAKGSNRSGSDIDIAVKGDRVDHNTILRIADSLNEESSMPYFFDVVHYDRLVNSYLIDHIDRVGKIFYKKS